MENNDFDIFELVKVLFKKKVMLFAFIIVFFGLSLLYLQNTPTKYRVNFVVSSSVLNQNEILLKVNQLVQLIDNKAYTILSQVLDIELKEAESIEFIEVAAVKNTPDLVDVNFSSSDVVLTNNFYKKLELFFDSDSTFVELKKLTKEQLVYSLQKYNQELDSIKIIKDFKGVYVQNTAQELNIILDKRNKTEKDLKFFNLLKVYDGAQTIKMESSLLINIVSSLMFSLAMSILMVLGLHFIKVFSNKISS